MRRRGTTGQPSSEELARLRAGLGHRYAFERELGRGGMGCVYLAHDRKHDRTVAIKVLRPAVAAAVGPERFLNEIQTVARLTHPHIVPLHDSGEAQGVLYYVMPYVEGESLRARLVRERQLPLDDAIRIAREVAEALSYAHGQNVLHRDIRPENILLESGHAVVVDFGIARAIRGAGEEWLTPVGTAVGSPAYMSPEQTAAGEAPDARSDLYSLGCVVYEMLAGQPPFTGQTFESIVLQQCGAAVPSLTVLRPALPPQVAAVVTRALAKAPADRFRTATAFAAALEHAGRSAPGRTAPRRWARAGAGAALGLALLAAGWWGVHALAAPPRPISRLAVLPFENFSGDTAQDYFVEGIHDALLTELAKIGALSVISRSSVLGYRHSKQPVSEIARQLHVDAVVEGAVVLAGDSVRVDAQLIAASNDRELWADTYVRSRRHVLELYADVARAIAGEVRVELSPAERAHLASARPVDPEANDLNLKGHYYCVQWSADAINRGIAFSRRAIDQDPTFAPAYAGLAECYANEFAAPREPPQDAYPKARAAIARALELDSTLGEAHATLGLIKTLQEYDWAGADREFRTALALGPGTSATHMWYAEYLVGMGRFDSAIAESRRAVELDPLAIGTSLMLGWTYLSARRYDEAVAQFRKTLLFDSTFAWTHMLLAWTVIEQGRRTDATRECAAALRTGSPEDQILLASCARVYAQAGQRADAVRLLHTVIALSRRTWVDPFNLAPPYEAIGDRERGIELLHRAIQGHSVGIFGLKVFPWLDGLRADPRFPSLLKEAGLSAAPD